MQPNTWWRRAMRCAALTLALTCSACGGPRMKADPPPPPDAALLGKCLPLPQPEDAKASTLLKNHVQTAKLYHQVCADHESLIEAATPPKDPEPRWWQFWRIYW